MVIGSGHDVTLTGARPEVNAARARVPKRLKTTVAFFPWLSVLIV